MSIKKIGIIGWWQGKNEGDNYIKHCLKKKFQKEYKIIFIETPFNANMHNLKKINDLDFLIIGGGGLFTQTPPYPFNTFNNWGHHLKIPFGFLGVGVQEINQKYKPIIEEIVDKSTFFVVRDKGSFDLIKSFSSKVIQSPDLTFLYPRKIHRKVIKGTVGINLRVWNFDEKRTYDYYKWCCKINQLPEIKKTIPLSFHIKLDDRWAMKCIQGIKNSSFDMNLYKDLEIMIGMRLHSLIFAVQNSIPIIGIAYTPKIRRFFSELNLKEFFLEVDEYDRLDEKIHEVLRKYEEISSKLFKYTFEANIAVTKCIENVKNIIEMDVI